METQEEPVVYYWPDASVARLSLAENRVSIRVQVHGRSEVSFVLTPGGTAGSVFLKSEPYQGVVGRRVRGFLLDLWDQVPRFSGGFPTAMVRVMNRVLLPHPTWVPDEERSRWCRELAVARPTQEDLRPGRAGPIRSFSITKTPERRWFLRWKRVGSSAAVPSTLLSSASTPERAVAALLRQEWLLPESEKERWMSENVEAGAWVLPDPEEVSLLGMLGEPNPLLLPIDKLRLWLQGRHP